MNIALRLGFAFFGSMPLVFASPVVAQGSSAQEGEDFLEIAPPKMALPTLALNQLLIAGSTLDRAELKSVISETALPDTSQGPIGVCFVDGDPSLLEDVIRYAKAWELSESSVRFEFGSAATRYCQPNAWQLVRVSFAGQGTWSVIGLEGRLAKGATMNFSSLENWKLVSEKKFRRAVQHEFGHALGLYHEHQSPDARCDLQIDWPAAGKLYRGKGFNLTDMEIQQNLGILTAPVVTESFDLVSIMIYDLPRSIFRSELFADGSQPSCYAGRINFSISSGDIATIKKYFPSNPEEVRRLRLVAFERSRAVFRSTLDGQAALAIVSSYFPFAKQGDATPFVDYAKAAIEARSDR